MFRNCIVFAITVLIALQSVASIAYEEQLHHASSPHHEHSLETVDVDSDSDSEVQTGNASQDKSQHSNADCHHNHSCFHMGLVIPLSNFLSTVESSATISYRANLLKGIHPPLLRPPIA